LIILRDRARLLERRGGGDRRLVKNGFSKEHFYGDLKHVASLFEEYLFTKPEWAVFEGARYVKLDTQILTTKNINQNSQSIPGRQAGC